jgi:hypothetical protein
VTGLTKRSGGGIALALVGGELVRRSVSGHCYLYEVLGIRTAPSEQGASISVPSELGMREFLNTEGRPPDASKTSRDGQSDQEWKVDAASEASFPASDAPSFTR